MAKNSDHPLSHVLKLNSDPGYGMKANRMPGPLKPVQAFAKGGKVQGKLVQFYAKGGAVKCAKGGKIKSPTKTVRGSVKEAKEIMGALKSVKKPASPPPGLAAASPMMPPMKKGGKVARKKMAAGGAAKTRLSEPKPDKIKKVTPRGG